MKEYYKINEISKLYGIGADSLRYYEKLGVLCPRRDTNGYRLYSLKDIYKLNIIRDLRQLDFPMKQIKEYLERQSIEQTRHLLQEEQQILRRRIEVLRAREQMLGRRIAALAAAAKQPIGICSVKTLPDRFCVRLSERITRDEEMDFAFQKLHQKHEDKIRDFGNQTIGATVSLGDLQPGVPNVFQNVFFILEDTAEAFDFLLPAGQYLSTYYKGDYVQSAERILELLQYAERAGLECPSDPFELYELDNRDTSRPEEFITQIQVRVAARSQKKGGVQ